MNFRILITLMQLSHVFLYVLKVFYSIIIIITITTIIIIINIIIIMTFFTFDAIIHACFFCFVSTADE